MTKEDVIYELRWFKCTTNQEKALNAIDTAIDVLKTDNTIEAKKKGEWDMFELISSAYYGKQYYFDEENGMVYSRASCMTMTFDEALREFLETIGD